MNKLEARRKNLENILQRLHTSNVNTSQTNAGMDNIAFGARKYSDIFIKEVLENLRYQTLAVTSKKYNIPASTISGWISTLEAQGQNIESSVDEENVDEDLKYDKHRKPGRIYRRYPDKLIKKVLFQSKTKSVNEISRMFDIPQSTVHGWFRRRKNLMGPGEQEEQAEVGITEEELVERVPHPVKVRKGGRRGSYKSSVWKHFSKLA